MLTDAWPAPVFLTLVMAFFAWKDTRGMASHGLRLATWAIYSVVPLLAWLLYLVALLVGIR
jgi:hypothetical protein